MARQKLSGDQSLPTSARLDITLPAADLARYQRLATATRQSLARYVREALVAYSAQIEAQNVAPARVPSRTPRRTRAA